MGVDNATLKDMYDRRYFLERHDFRDNDLRRSFADTGMSVERLFVYLEVARSIDVPASLAREKYHSLGEVGKRSRAIALTIERELTRQQYGTGTGLADAQELVQQYALPKVSLPAPPLPTYVLRLAEKRDCSILDAVRAITGATEAGYEGLQDRGLMWGGLREGIKALASPRRALKRAPTRQQNRCSARVIFGNRR